MSAEKEFYRLARRAVRAGYLTPHEVRLIGRFGTRKFGHWDRALLDLRGVVAERTGRRK